MIKTLPDNEIKALIRLIADEEEDNAVRLKENLVSIIKNDPERVESIVSRDFVGNIPEFLSVMMEEARWESLEKMFAGMAKDNSGDLDLEEGLFLLSKFMYPAISLRDVSTALDVFASEVKNSVDSSAELGSLIAALNTVLFKTHSFRGFDSTALNPDSLYLYSVLDKKIGMPISMAALYILVARRLELPVAGVALPGHFIVQFKAWSGNIFIDPFNAGRVLSERECQVIVTHRGLHWSPEFLAPVSSRHMISRTMANLIFIYNKQKDERRAKYLKKYMDVLQGQQ